MYNGLIRRRYKIRDIGQNNPDDGGKIFQTPLTQFIEKYLDKFLNGKDKESLCQKLYRFMTFERHVRFCVSSYFQCKL